jgi:hypothetical protein
MTGILQYKFQSMKVLKDLRKVSISLLCKWWWLLEKEEGLWQDSEVEICKTISYLPDP